MHETVTVVLKSGQVDIAIRPIVVFLNGFPSVVTLNSCQGMTPCDQVPLGRQPYVSFHCDDLLTLQLVLTVFSSRRNVECKVDVWKSRLRYVLRWPTVAQIQDDGRRVSESSLVDLMAGLS